MSRTTLTYNEKSIGDIMVFHLDGKIMGCQTTLNLCKHIKDLLEEDKKHFVIDLEKVKWINSMGIGFMIACLTSSRNKGGDLRFSNVHDATKKYFTITKLDTVVKLFDTIDEAVNSFSS